MKARSDCIFCLIATGEAPAERLYEDDATVAFMDINPATDGHCLVIPRRHAQDIWSLDEVGDPERISDAATRLRGAIGRASP
jgi:histidine triad (HIT) family protein